MGCIGGRKAKVITKRSGNTIMAFTLLGNAMEEVDNGRSCLKWEPGFLLKLSAGLIWFTGFTFTATDE